MKKPFLLMTLFSLLLAAPGHAQPGDLAKGAWLATFVFSQGEDRIDPAREGNQAALDALDRYIAYEMSDVPRQEIRAVVEGWCPSPGEAQRTAAVVRQMLIDRYRLAPDNVVVQTAGSSFTKSYLSVVVSIPMAAAADKVAEVRRQMAAGTYGKPEPEPAPKPQPEPGPESVTVVNEPVETPEPAATHPAKPYSLAVRTNILYDAFLLPTLGVEWRISPTWGVKVDGSYSYWGSETGNVQKMWLVSPEVRLYMLDNKRFYVGVGGNYGKYNTYGYLLGGMWPDNTGYQGSLWNAGVTVGYQLKLARTLSLDFNLGLGYMRFEYDSFNMIDRVRVYKAKDLTKTFWGPTQAGITLVWKIAK